MQMILDDQYSNWFYTDIMARGKYPAYMNRYFDKLADGVNTNYDREMFPAFGDKVLTLSTCYKQNRMQRYLVQAKLTAQYSLLDAQTE